MLLNLRCLGVIWNAGARLERLPVRKTSEVSYDVLMIHPSNSGVLTMVEKKSHSLTKRIAGQRSKLTPKNRLLADYVLENPRKAVFMTVSELASASGVSDSTVVRFVSQLGYEGYGEFSQDLRDYVDTELTLLDRMELSDLKGPGAERFRRVVFEEIDNLRQLYERVDLPVFDQMVDEMSRSPRICVIGSRLSSS